MEKNSVHILFIISFFITFMKGADLLLRKDQQNWLQDKLETLTLKLNYVNFFKKLASNLNITLISTVGLGSLGILCIIATIFANNHNFSIKPQGDPWLVISTLGLSYYIYFKTKTLRDHLFNYVIGIDLKENKDIYTLKIFYFRITKAIIINLLLIIIAIITYSSAIYAFNIFYLKTENLNFYFYNILLISMASIDFFNFLIFIIIISTFFLIIIILHSAVKTFEGICWRIVEYNKGAFAAINTITTVLLGIIELCLDK